MRPDVSQLRVPRWSLFKPTPCRLEAVAAQDTCARSCSVRAACSIVRCWLCSVKRWKRIGPFLCASVGALFYCAGFSGLYAAATGRIPAPLWLLATLAYLSSNGGTWLEAAALTTCVSNFETERGAVVGILKAFLGLSASVYTTLYVTLCREPLDFLRLLAVVPTAIALFASLGVNLVPFRQFEPHSKAHAFHMAMNATLSLAIYQLVSALYFRSHTSPGQNADVVRLFTLIACITLKGAQSLRHLRTSAAPIPLCCVDARVLSGLSISASSHSLSCSAGLDNVLCGRMPPRAHPVPPGRLWWLARGAARQ